MHQTNHILIRAPRERIFEVTANLALWPEILPHYRYIRFLERHGDRSIVQMAAVRDGIPIAWTSEHIVDREHFQMTFRHLKAWTKGMLVVWTYSPTPEGIHVEIRHDLRFRFPPLAPVADRIIGSFFIDNIARKTLSTFKAHLEAEAGTA